MTVGDLRAELAKLHSDLDAVIILNGSLSPVIEVLAVPGADFVVIRGKRAGPPPRKFTINEEGVVGHLVRIGLSNEKIGEILGRPTKAVVQKRKTLGF
jgi:hypothetical protein